MNGGGSAEQEPSRKHDDCPKNSESIDELFRMLISETEEEIRRSENLGDTRFNLFLTLFSVSLAALAAALSDLSVDRLLVGICVLGFAALLLIGWSTFLRILKRNVATDEAIEANARMMRFLVERYGGGAEIKWALPFDPYGLEGDPPIKVRSKGLLNPITSGGLAQTMMLLNGFISFVFGILVYLFVHLYSDKHELVIDEVFAAIPIGLVAGIVGVLVHLAKAKVYYTENEKDRRNRIRKRTLPKKDEYSLI